MTIYQNLQGLENSVVFALTSAGFFLVHVAVAARAVLRPHREPSSRVAWVVVIFVMPMLGIVTYILLGETNIGRRRVARMREALARLPAAGEMTGSVSGWASMPDRYASLFRVGRTVNGFEAVGGNRGRLMADAEETIRSLIADIDAAQLHVHLVFYIWLPDRTGLAVADALVRAALRGVVCRVMADALGSRAFVGSEHWSRMQAAGVRAATALPIGNVLLRPLRGRIDLRNHRKIVVIDNKITYCGSRNCADPEFLVKEKYAPWVDVMMRFEGPIVRQNQYVFASDWMAQGGEDLAEICAQPVASVEPGMTAQVIATGPTVRYSAMPEVFETLMYAAREELVITTPYYVPDESMQSALCAAARRGVATTLIFPARNDSWIVSAACHSYYVDLLSAGVQIFEYNGGLLHAKTLTLDGEVTLIGSANMDRRSFELNYENNILFYDPELTQQVRRRQDAYLSQSHPVTLESAAGWSVTQRLWNNTIAMLGPVL